jgi:hypothetical protein
MPPPTFTRTFAAGSSVVREDGDVVAAILKNWPLPRWRG